MWRFRSLCPQPTSPNHAYSIIVAHCCGTPLHSQACPHVPWSRARLFVSIPRAVSCACRPGCNNSRPGLHSYPCTLRSASQYYSYSILYFDPFMLTASPWRRVWQCFLFSRAKAPRGRFGRLSSLSSLQHTRLCNDSEVIIFLSSLLATHFRHSTCSGRDCPKKVHLQSASPCSSSCRTTLPFPCSLFGSPQTQAPSPVAHGRPLPSTLLAAPSRPSAVMSSVPTSPKCSGVCLSTLLALSFPE
jgi:hypothetical protein